VRRPPIAQKRITNITERSVTFWAKDKKLGRRVFVTCSLEDFIDRWSQHIPERYCHSVRSFGLFSPRALTLTSEALFRSLGQPRRKRPLPRRWADSIKRDFGRDPLLDPQGQKMKWVGRVGPQSANLYSRSRRAHSDTYALEELPVASVAIHRAIGGCEGYTVRKQAVKIQLRKLGWLRCRRR
jgi:hypothetical protein